MYTPTDVYVHVIMYILCIYIYQVVWFENSGSLSFAAGVTINSGLTAAGPAKGVDLDGDDDNDVVVTDTDTGMRTLYSIQSRTKQCEQSTLKDI